MTNNTGFRSLSLSNWRQFSRLDIDVHPKLTIITGSNGAGKSTVLNIFTQHFGVTRPYLGTPKKTKSGSYAYDIGLRYTEPKDASLSSEMNDKEDSEEDFEPQYTGRFIEFGKIIYSNGQSSSIGTHEQSAQSYGLQINAQQAVSGVHIGSHRALTNYQPVMNINLQPMRAAQAYNMFNQEIMTRYGGGHTGFSPIYRMKEALIGMAAFGEGNSYLQSDADVLSTFEGFIDILKIVLPEEIGFKSLAIRIPDVVLQTRSGDFLLDSSSGGVNAIIEIAWQIYLYSRHLLDAGQNFFVVTMDEPENHLHPSMQRAIIPNLIAAFPTAQFIVATHSPFVVSAIEDSSVYVLNYSGKPPGVSDADTLPENRRVSAVKLDRAHKGGTAGEILREVLGVPVTTPQWVQSKVDQILLEFIGQPISNEILNSLRKRLSDNGFGELYPEALSKLVEAKDQPQ